jgi:arylsulfatase A-like enzyme
MIAVIFACNGDDSATPPPATSFLEFPERGPRNLLMLSIDTLRKDHLSRYGHTGLTPFLAEKMAEGVPLDAHISCSNWTFPSAMCVFGGRTNTDMSIVPALAKDRRPTIPEDHGQLPVWLRDAGWQTGLVSSNSYIGTKYNTAVGYELFDGGYQKAEDMADRGRDMLKEFNHDDPWYLHIHFRDAHVPYTPPDEYLTGLEDLEPLAWDLSKRDPTYDVLAQFQQLTGDEQELLLAHLAVRYEGAIRYTDDALRGLWESMDREGLLDETLVVVWSDHGEQFFEHDLYTHAYSMHYAENDALGFFWSKDLSPGEWTEPTSHIDLAPTILEALGRPIPSVVTGEPVGRAPENRILHTVSDARLGIMMSLQTGGTKLQYRWSNGEKELYHRGDDPWEQTDVYESSDAEVIALWTELEAEINRVIPLVPEDKIPEDRGP